MKRVLGRARVLAIVALGVSAGATSAQDRLAAPVTPNPRLSLEGGAGLQVHYQGSTQSVALGFAPSRNLTLLVGAQRSYVEDRITRYENGYDSERGSTEHLITAEVRYAFFTSQRVSPYVLVGAGRGISRPNVTDYFPDKKERGIQAFFYGGGVRIPVRPRLDAFVDARIVMAVEARSDYFGVRFPVRAGMAWRF